MAQGRDVAHPDRDQPRARSDFGEDRQGWRRRPRPPQRGAQESGAIKRCVTDTNCPLPRSEEHTSELQSLMRISYAVFCLKKKNKQHSLNLRDTEKTIKHITKWSRIP